MSAAGSRAIEHGSNRTSRGLRERRVRIALWIAVLEGLLVVFDAIDWWVSLLVAAAVLGVYVFYGRTAPSDTTRQVTWIAAASQVMVALVPVLVAVVGTLALIAVAILAVAALVYLLRDRG